MNRENLQEWLDALKPYENDCKTCKRLVSRLEQKIKWIEGRGKA